MRASTASASATLILPTVASAAPSSVSPAASSTSSGVSTSTGRVAEADDAAGLERPHLHRPVDTLIHHVFEGPCRRAGALGGTAAHDASAQHGNRSIAEHHGRALACRLDADADAHRRARPAASHLAPGASPGSRPRPERESGRGWPGERPGFAIATQGFGSRSAQNGSRRSQSVVGEFYVDGGFTPCRGAVQQEDRGPTGARRARHRQPRCPIRERLAHDGGLRGTKSGDVNLGTGERGERQRQAGGRRFGRIRHRHDVPRFLLQRPMPRKERAHVTVWADAEQHHIESGRRADGLPRSV